MPQVLPSLQVPQVPQLPQVPQVLPSLLVPQLPQVLPSLLVLPYLSSCRWSSTRGSALARQLQHS